MGSLMGLRRRRSFSELDVERLLATAKGFRAGRGSFDERWRSTAEGLRALIPACGLSVLSFPADVLTCYPSSDQAFVEFRCRHDPEVSRRFAWNFDGLDDYLARYADRDPSAAALIRRRGEPVRLSQVVGEARRGDDPFTGEFLPHWNLRHVLAAVPPLDEASRVSIALYRERGQPDFSPREEGLLRMLTPSLREVCQEALREERLARAGAASSEGRAFFIFGEDGAVELGPAEAILSAFPARLPAGEFLARGRRELSRSGARQICSRLRLADGRWLEVHFDAMPDRGLTAVSLTVLSDGSRRRFEAAARAAGLSPREREVAALVGRGLANKEIAWKLGISKNTVKEYLSKAYVKTGADGRAALIAFLYGGG